MPTIKQGWRARRRLVHHIRRDRERGVVYIDSRGARLITFRDDADEADLPPRVEPIRFTLIGRNA